jgi:hypothetical protein
MSNHAISVREGFDLLVAADRRFRRRLEGFRGLGRVPFIRTGRRRHKRASEKRP